MCQGAPAAVLSLPPFRIRRLPSCTGVAALLCDSPHGDAVCQPFHCAVCLELVYKPAVQCCGHVLCLCCAFGAMNPKSGNSRCPVCRRRYHHLPRVCGLLHSLLKKLNPHQYQLRAEDDQDLEDSSTSSCFTTTIDNDTSSIAILQTMVCEKLPLAGALLQEEDIINGLSTKDLSCSLCSKLLYRPIVLNCGEVFCESCVKMKGEDFVMCPTCSRIQFDAPISVCLELDGFIERIFPEDYAERRDEVFLLESDKAMHVAEEYKSLSVYVSHPAQMNFHKDESESAFVHEGVGCDGCGMYPIEGARYRCMDCTGKKGFDLCALCYSTKASYNVGHFGQMHDAGNHRMALHVPPFFGLASRSAPFQLNLSNGIISQRRRQHYYFDHSQDCF